MFSQHSKGYSSFVVKSGRTKVLVYFASKCLNDFLHSSTFLQVSAVEPIPEPSCNSVRTAIHAVLGAGFFFQKMLFWCVRPKQACVVTEESQIGAMSEAEDKKWPVHCKVTGLQRSGIVLELILFCEHQDKAAAIPNREIGIFLPTLDTGNTQ